MNAFEKLDQHLTTAPVNYFKELGDHNDISFTNPLKNIYVNVYFDPNHPENVVLTDDGSIFEDFYPLTYDQLSQSQRILIKHYLNQADLILNPNSQPGNNHILMDSRLKTVQTDLITFCHQVEIIQKSLQHFTHQN